MDLQARTETLRAKVGNAGDLNATLKFDCVAYPDGRSVLSTVDISRENPVVLLSGEPDPASGFMMGRFELSGDMSFALKLQRFV